MRSFIFLALLVASVSANSLFKNEWEEWKDLHEKSYSYEEDIRRQYIWEQNLKKVIQHNEEASSGMHTYTLGMNQYADMSSDEFKGVMLGTKIRTGAGRCNMTFEASADAHIEAKSVDWRTKGYVTPVKNQGQCGQSWTFSTTGSVEGQHFRQTGKLIPLSEQNVVDCCEGCSSASMGFEYIIKNHGIDSEASYPTKSDCKQACRFNPKAVGATISSYVAIKSGDENVLKEAVADIGPVAVVIDAGHSSFQLYRSGVYYEAKCDSSKLDHATLVVGFGEENGADYWIVKNSWGAAWGEKGYIMMSRNRNNNCGIASIANYPVV